MTGAGRPGVIAWPMELIDSTVTSTRAILATYALTAAYTSA
jgi:hypothetical protein